MTARYWVQASDELMSTRQIPWPEGLRPVGGPGVSEFRGSRWHLFEDDGAPEDLEGKKVELTLARRGRETGITVIVERKVLP